MLCCVSPGALLRQSIQAPAAEEKPSAKNTEGAKEAGGIFIDERHHADMEQRLPSLRTIIRKMENPADRSPLFHWMCEHHDKMLEASRGRRIQWRPLCPDFAEQGLTAVGGKPVTALIASRTWAKVRQEVLRLRALEKPKLDRPRVQAPENWQPPVVNRDTVAHRPTQPRVAEQAASGTQAVSLLTKPKSEAQRIADIAMTKHPQARTSEEKLAVVRAERERRSYSS